jgi:hypothetical protein
MKNTNAKSASAKSNVISDAKMAAVLANSNWAKMERDAKKVAATTTKKRANKTAVKTHQLVVIKKMAVAHDVDPVVISSLQMTVTDGVTLPPD